MHCCANRTQTAVGFSVVVDERNRKNAVNTVRLRKTAIQISLVSMKAKNKWNTSLKQATTPQNKKRNTNDGIQWCWHWNSCQAADYLIIHFSATLSERPFFNGALEHIEMKSYFHCAPKYNSFLSDGFFDVSWKTLFSVCAISIEWCDKHKRLLCVFVSHEQQLLQLPPKHNDTRHAPSEMTYEIRLSRARWPWNWIKHFFRSNRTQCDLIIITLIWYC